MPHPDKKLHVRTHSAESQEDVHQQQFQKTPTPTSNGLQNVKSRSNNIMADEDKYYGWDGPVWCSRFGRFENQEDAAHDDGYPNDPKSPIFEDRQLHRCEKSTCQSAVVPTQHHFFAKDIKRRLEPIAQSLVHLEHQVQHLVRHVMKDEKTFNTKISLHDEAKNGGTIAVHHGELGDWLHEPIRDHNHISETASYLESSHPPAIDASGLSGELSPKPNTPPAAIDYSASLNHGTRQELSHPRHAHYKEGFNQEGPPLETIKNFDEVYNQEWPHYKHVCKEQMEPTGAITKLEEQVEKLSRQMKALIGIVDGPKAA